MFCVLRRCFFFALMFSVVLVHTWVIAMFIGCVVGARIGQRNVYGFCKLPLVQGSCLLGARQVDTNFRFYDGPSFCFFPVVNNACAHISQCDTRRVQCWSSHASFPCSRVAVLVRR